MEYHQKLPAIMATHSYRKALSYLLFSILALISSLWMTALFTSDLSQHIDTHLARNEAWMNYVVAVLFGLVLLGGSILSLRTALQNFFIAHKLEKNGNQTDGVITNKWEDTFERRVLYHVSYRFHEDIEAWEVISKRLYHKLSKGSYVPIRYLEYDPSVARLNYERLSA
jgi:hypothetical protein